MPNLLEDAELREGAWHVQRYELQGLLPGEGGGGPPAGGGRGGGGGRPLPAADQRLGPLHQDGVELRGQVQLQEQSNIQYR